MKEDKSIIFTISRKEIDRRIIAYTTLIVSFLAGSIIFSFNNIIAYVDISLYIILAFSIVLFLSRIITIRYFNSILKNQIILTPKYFKKNDNKYLIEDIERVNIQRTSIGYIREIKIILNSKKVTFINGIDNFEKFADCLIKYIPKNTVISYSKEPLDFDHPTFYFFFGILVSLVSIKFLEIFIALKNEQLKIVYYVVSISAILLGLYFIINKPIYKRDEKNKQITDYIWGLSFVLAGILILIFYLF